jgi:hypothetical protein
MPTVDPKAPVSALKVQDGPFQQIAILTKRVDDLESSLEATAASYNKFSSTLTDDLDILANDIEASLKDMNIRKAEAMKVSEAFGSIKDEVRDLARARVFEHLQATESVRLKEMSSLKTLAEECKNLAGACITGQNKLRDSIKEIQKNYKFLLYCFTGFVLINIMLALYAFHLL